MIRQLRTDSRRRVNTTSFYGSPSAERRARSVVRCGLPPEIYDRHPAPLRHGAWSQVHLTVPTCPFCSVTCFATATPTDGGKFSMIERAVANQPPVQSSLIADAAESASPRVLAAERR
jgi:hypothetical protein